jgi:hypothetical protein
MKQEHKLYLGIAVLVLLGVGVYLVQTSDKKHAEQHTVTAAQDLPVVKLSKEEAEKVTKFVIKNADKGEVTLEKKGEAWQITAPLGAPADQAAVKSLVENLEKIEVTGLIASTAEVHAKYELDEAKAVHARAYTGDQLVLDMYFGKRGTRGQMARMGGEGAKPDVYSVDGYASFSWAKELKGWRDKDIFKFEDGNVIAAEIENEHGKLSFTKDGDSWKGKAYPRKDDKLGAAKDIEGFDEAKVKSMLSAFKNLKATDFAADGDDSGVDAALEEGGIVRFTLKDDDKPKYVARVGKQQKGSNRFVAKEGDDTVYVITSWTADWATAEAKKFQKEDKGEEGEGDEDAPKGAEKGAPKDAKKDAPKKDAPKSAPPPPKAAEGASK